MGRYKVYKWDANAWEWSRSLQRGRETIFSLFLICHLKSIFESLMLPCWVNMEDVKDCLFVVYICALCELVVYLL